MTHSSDIRLADAYETDLPEMVDYRTLEYNRAYFANKEANERDAAAGRPTTAATDGSDSKRSKGARRSESRRTTNDSADATDTRRPSQSPTKFSRQKNSNSPRRSQTKPIEGRNFAHDPVPTAPPSEDTDGLTSANSRYSITELVATIGSQEEVSKLPAELQRRVLDFRLAQQKRREKYGRQKKWGIFGLYAYLSELRLDLEWAEDSAWRRNNSKPYLSWTDFEACHKKGANRPWFTYALLVVCTIMMFVEFGLGDWKVAPMSENPMIGPSAQALIKAGARYTPLIVDKGQWFRIFSPLFLHAGLIHFFINMGALWFVGAAVEQTHGMLNAMILFFVPGIGGNILSSICLPQYISVGASGGIFGLIGGCLADIAMHWQLLFMRTEERGQADGDPETNPRKANTIAVVWLVVDILLNVIIGFTPYVDNFCHLGGLVYGFACGWSAITPMSVTFLGVSDTKWSKVRKLVARFCGLIFSMVMIIATTAILASMGSDSSPCSNCRYLSCIPFPPFREDKFWYCDDCTFVTASLYKEGDDSSIYTQIELTCPNKVIENIPINSTDSDDISKRLPSYCRDWCDERFA